MKDKMFHTNVSRCFFLISRDSFIPLKRMGKSLLGHTRCEWNGGKGKVNW